MSSESAQARIYARLAEAASGIGLEVRTHADLDGASVAGPVVEAYVVAVPRSGFQVEMWRPNGRNPYEIKRCGDLDEAVTVAVAAATGRRRSAVAALADPGEDK
ncbi:hypothetical protein AB0M47_11335 [Hamadaea sp. NPDC051192]|uniref:hypothetical protein n=1 Tax=Hamadaea sp. NPDC051192 TaxID=3154940 RepID=UPI0034350EBE